MGKAFADMLPYTLGLIVSPFPVVAVIALLISANGRAKALLFEATWLIMSWVVLSPSSFAGRHRRHRPRQTRLGQPGST